MPPIGGVDRGYYETARPTLQIPISGPRAALPLRTSPFGLHQGAAPLRGEFEAVNLINPDIFSLQIGPWRWLPAQRTSLRRLYGFENTPLHVAGTKALDAVDVIELYVSDDYTPANGAVYPDSSFGDHLQVIAQMMKLELGLHVATIDLGDWDTHDGQDYYLPLLLDDLSRGLQALYTDLDGSGAQNYTQNLTVVAMSEFGRRLEQNADNGTDHGHGNLMMVLGGNVNGGIHGVWPGLAPGQLFEGIDVAVTTDYRTILSEILIRRLANNRLGTIFPGFTDYSPLGIVTGADLPPDFGDAVFSDGFEGGDLSAWSSST